MIWKRLTAKDGHFGPVAVWETYDAKDAKGAKRATIVRCDRRVPTGKIRTEYELGMPGREAATFSSLAAAKHAAAGALEVEAILAEVLAMNEREAAREEAREAARVAEVLREVHEEQLLKRWPE